jgi:hypothetical protein
VIRKYELDPTLVKRSAADFCGTEALRDASRDLVEAVISTLAEEAAKDRAALICKLNSYSQLAKKNFSATWTSSLSTGDRRRGSQHVVTRSANSAPESAIGPVLPTIRELF